MATSFLFGRTTQFSLLLHHLLSHPSPILSQNPKSLSSSFHKQRWQLQQQRFRLRLHQGVAELHVHRDGASGEDNLALIPLCERTQTHAVSLQELLRWRQSARAMAVSVSSRLFDLDGGPTARELLKELEWYLDDAVEKCSLVVHDQTSGRKGIKRKELSSWGELKALLSISEPEESEPSSGSVCHPVDAGADQVVLLRTSLRSLDMNWQIRVKERRPFQYVVSCAHWRDLVLAVQEGVLIPRPETEQLIDIAIAAMDENEELRRGVWADLGTGSGAIAIALACLLEGDGMVYAVDISEVAVAVAAQNIRRYGLQGRVEAVQGSWFSPVQNKKLAGVISNPPYIPSNNIHNLQAEVGRHEPKIALDGGPGGLDYLHIICNESACALRMGGVLALETNGGEQVQIVADFLSTTLSAYFCNVKVVDDCFGISRFVSATRR